MIVDIIIAKFNYFCEHFSLLISTYKYFKMLSNFRLYFKTMKEIVYQFEGTGPNRVAQLKLINVLLFLKILHELFLMTELSDNWRMINCDYLHMARLPSELHVISLLMFLLTMIVYNRLYFYDRKRYFPHLSILGQVLFEPQNTYFLAPQNGEPPKEIAVRKLMHRIFLYSQFFSLGLTLLMGAIQWYILLHVYANIEYYLQTLTGFFSLLIIQLNLCFFDFALLSMAVSNMIAGSYCIYFTISTFIRLRQINQRYLFSKQATHPQLAWFYFRYFTRYHTQTLLVIFSYNQIFGQLLTFYIAINFPVNTFLFHLVVSGRISNVAIIFYLFLIAGQTFFIFVLHLLAAMFTSRIHSVTKHLTQINIHSNFRNVHYKIGMHLYIGKFQCEPQHQYGITYGSLETSVTLLSFLRVHLRNKERQNVLIVFIYFTVYSLLH